MKRVKECKVSLMEKDHEFSVDENGRGNYIIRTSGTFLPEDYMEQNPHLKEVLHDQDAYIDYVSQASMLIAEELQSETKGTPVDSIGIWITFDDDTRIESSMDLSVMDAMAEHHEDLNPFFEFAKMTLQPFYESEVSE
jgi:hypothetical protein